MTRVRNVFMLTKLVKQGGIVLTMLTSLTLLMLLHIYSNTFIHYYIQLAPKHHVTAKLCNLRGDKRA